MIHQSGNRTFMRAAALCAVALAGFHAAQAGPAAEEWGRTRYVAGPGGSRAVELYDNGFVNLGAASELELPQTSIELIFKLNSIPGRTYNPSLIAMRNDNSVRFSLHIMHDLSQLVMWNGRAPVIFPVPGGKLAVENWHHALLTWQGQEVTLYLNGVSLGKKSGSFNIQAQGLPLLVGASSLAGAEWCTMSAGEVAVYSRALTAEEAAAHAAPVGKGLALKEHYAPLILGTAGLVAYWRMEGTLKDDKSNRTGSFVVDDSRSPHRVSLLSSQLGYQTESSKRAYIRDLDRQKIADDTAFTVHRAEDNAIVHQGQAAYWGEKWGSHWWVLDFSDVKADGKYTLKVEKTQSNPFFVGRTPLMQYEMVDIALTQLDARHNHGEPNTYLNGKLRFHGRWMTPDGTHPQGIYRDCMSNFSEIQSIGMTTMGLISLYRYQKDAFSAEDQKRIRDYIVLGADYITACQRKTDDPKTNGRFAHSILVNTLHDGCGWSGNVYGWHDMAYAMVVLCKAYESVKPFNPEKAQNYLDAAKLAYTCATFRPYHLPEEYELAQRDDNYDPVRDYDKARWTPKLKEFRTDPSKIRAGWNNYQQFARMFYNKPDSWTEPQTLKTREKLPFLHGCTLLYRISGELKYLESAVEFAASIAYRQFNDWRNPIEGVYGTFFEFEGDDEALSIECGQAGGKFMGHIDALNVNGFIELLRLMPDHPDAAKWLNVVKTYTDRYVRKAAEINPLGIHPVSVYRDPEHGGVKFFMNLLHGATGHYGQMAENILELADFLNDSSLVPLAEANLQFYTGLNPGVPQGANAWKAATLINKVGPSYYNTGGEGIKGGVINGFMAGRNWVLTPISAKRDAPDLAGGQEDWVAHSHPYVGAAARMENPFTLVVHTSDNGKPVAATVRLSLPETSDYTTGEKGSVTVADLPVNRKGTLSASFGKQTITRELDTVPGGTLTWKVDFAEFATLTLEVPDQLGLRAEGQAVVRISNLGSKAINGKVHLSADGATLAVASVDIALPVGETREIPIACKGGDRVMPYLVSATLKTGRGVLATASRQGLAGEKGPNILVIFVDDVGYNDLGCYDARDPAIQTPNMDRMAAEGIRFTDWQSACSVCAPSRAALLTGRYPSRCGLPIVPSGRQFGENYRQNIGLQQSEITIPELLKPLGYRTAMYGKSHLGDDRKFYPLRHGFDEYYGALGNFPVRGTHPVLEGDEVVEPAARFQDIHIKLTERTVGFMKKSQKEGKPFFIYLAHYLAHGPWDPNREFATDEEWEIYQNQPIRGHLKNGGDKVYPALMRELDWHVGEVLKAIKDLGIDEETLVFLVSDNGHWEPAGSAWPLRGSKFNTFEGGHRVPAIARWPGTIPPGQVSDAICSTMDIFPTIAHFTGAELPDDRKIDGLEISRVLRGKTLESGHEILYYYNGITLEAVRAGKWKLHLPRTPPAKVFWAKGALGGFRNLEHPVLYNLDADIGEKTDVAAEHTEVVERMLALAQKTREELGDWNLTGTDQKKLLDYTGDINNPVRAR
jgi:arylsulfatase A-like enzyme